MKTFTYPTNKWVLTGALLAVLGVNVSFNTNKYGIATADFSSEIAESKLTTVDGVMPVKYIKIGENEVLAIVPTKMTEGKVCETCGTDKVTLTSKNTEDLDALNVQLLKKLQESKTVTEAKDEVTEKKVTAKPVEKEEEEKPDRFAAITEACKAKKYKSNQDRLSCLSDKFVKLLKSKEGKDIDSNDALNFYKKEIERKIVTQLEASRRAASNALRTNAGMSYRSRYGSEDTPEVDASEMRTQVVDVLENLNAKIPTEFEDVRQRVMKTQDMMMTAEALDIRRSMQTSEQNKGTAEGLLAMYDVRNKTNYLNVLSSDLYNSTDKAMAQAVSDGLDAGLADKYINSFVMQSQEMQKRVNQELDLFWQTNKVPVSTLPGTVGGGIDLSGRIGANRGGSPVVPQQQGGVSNRTSTIVGTDGQVYLVTPAQQQSVVPQNTVIPSIPATNSPNITFGTPGAISADNLRLRTEIQTRFQRQ